MATNYQFTMDVRVFDEAALESAAMRHPTGVDGLSTDEARDTLRPRGERDIGACLVAIFDPGHGPEGVEIRMSQAVCDDTAEDE